MHISNLKKLWTSKTPGYITARVLILVVVGLIVVLMTFEDKLIFYPTRYPDGLWNLVDSPARSGETVPEIEDCYFTSADGVRLHGWYCMPHRSATGRLERIPTDRILLWFHGNAGNLSYRYEMIRTLMKLPVEIFIIDY